MSLLIQDDQTLVSVTNRYDRELPVYDDGFGKLYVYRDSMGIRGVVRAMSWEDAFEIAVDEFLPVVTYTDELAEIEQHFKDTGDLPEGYRFQANATGSGIVSYDLNGEYLDELTDQLAKELELAVVITND